MVRSRILELVEKHEAARALGINLIASENLMSLQGKRALASDLAGRYAGEWYGGSQTARDIMEETEALARSVFRADHALVAPLAGNLCDLAVVFAFTRPGDPVAMVPTAAGGYPLGLQKFDRVRLDLPAASSGIGIDEAASRDALAAARPGLLLLAQSFILFPLPLEGVSAALKQARPDAVCVYDGSHVLGLIACREFQDPLREGADVLIGSTHKSLYGPQGGLIVTNSAPLADRLRAYFALDFERGLGLVDNPHPNRVAALGVALEELQNDLEYGRNVVANARALARELSSFDVPVKFKDRGFTASHQILLDLEPPRAAELCRQLESVGIFADLGGRLGVAEASHNGWGEPEMAEIAEMISTVYHKGPGEEVRARVREFSESV